MTRLFSWEIGVEPWIFLPGIILGCFVLGFLVRAALTAGKEKESPGRSFATVLPFLSALLGAFVILHGYPMESGPAALIRKILVVLMILVGAYFVGRGILAAVRHWAKKRDMLKSVETPSRFIVSIGMTVLGLLVILDTLDVSIAPLLTTLGIGGLALALAMNDSLSNLIAGLYLAADQPVRQGDFVEIDKDKQGTIEKVGWRSTRLRTLTNNVIIIPNNKLAQAIVINYDFPDPKMLYGIPVSVAYGSDTRRVAEVLLEVASQAAADLEGVLADPPPRVRFNPGFGESSLDFTVVLHLRKFVDQYGVRDELRHRFYERLKAEGITIPFPQRDVHLHQAS